LDEISQGPKRDFRLPPGRWLVLAAIGGLVTVIAAVLVLANAGGHHAIHPPRVLAAPSSSQTSAPGTVLLSCQSANWGQLGPNWRAGSVKAGPLWFVYGGQDGYVHIGRFLSQGRDVPGRAKAIGGVMIIEVADGPAVTMKAVPRSQSYFRLFDGFHSGGGNPLPAGDTGFTFVPCPRTSPGPNGPVTDFYLGFSIEAGRAAPVEVWASASYRPLWLTFTAPSRRKQG
jgi:hypothetical protein